MVYFLSDGILVPIVVLHLFELASAFEAQRGVDYKKDQEDEGYFVHFIEVLVKKEEFY